MQKAAYNGSEQQKSGLANHPLLNLYSIFTDKIILTLP